MLPCPECHCPGAVIRTERCSNGSLRRRHQCSVCRHRWTSHEGEPPGHRGGWPEGRPGHGSGKRLKPEEVKRILQSDDLSILAIARRMGRSHPAVAAVLMGRTHADLWPELPRRQTLSCEQCLHWERGRCQMGFPDPEQDGPAAASWCNNYQPNP